MRSGFDPASYDWASEYYSDLADLEASAFIQRVFAAKPALVARAPQSGHRVTEEYIGQPYDADQYDLVIAAWSHDHCRVCRFRLEAGFTYWETSDRAWILCDECHAHVAQRTRGGSE